MKQFVEPRNRFIWSCFWTLSSSRNRSMGLEPIKMTEIQAYFNVFDINDLEQRRRIVLAINSMDQAFLDWSSSNGTT